MHLAIGPIRHSESRRIFNFLIRYWLDLQNLAVFRVDEIIRDHFALLELVTGCFGLSQDLNDIAPFARLVLNLLLTAPIFIVKLHFIALNLDDFGFLGWLRLLFPSQLSVYLKLVYLPADVLEVEVRATPVLQLFILSNPIHFN